MVKHKIAVALRCGAGFTSLLILLLNSVLAMFCTPFLMPGGILAHVVVRSEDFGQPLLVLAANSLFYSVAAYVGISIFGRGVAAEKIRFAAIGLALPVAILLGLACVPRFNPLWPHGMTELAKQEKDLQESLPVGMELERARAVLRSKGIAFHEQTETSQKVVLERSGRTITAATGDRVISARFDTEASQFPCGYAMKVILLFGPDEKLKDQYIQRLRICP
jgi:hypothetical protein